MENHFFKRLLTVIITFVVVFSLSYIFEERTLIEGARNRGIIALFFVFLVIIAVILGLILDSIILYRRKEKDKASESLLVLFILLLTIFLAIVISFN